MGQVTVVHDGRQLRLGNDVGRRVCCSPAGPDCDALFEWLELGHGRVVLRTADGCYLAARPDPGLSFGLYPTDALGPTAAFEEVRWPDGQVSLRSCHLGYVSADPTGLVTANRTEAGCRERFRLRPATAMVPAQRGPARTPAEAAR